MSRTTGRWTERGGWKTLVSCVSIACFAAGAAGQAWHYEVVDLGTLGGEHSMATAMNEQGVVVGAAETGDPFYEVHAFLWRDGEMLDLKTLGGFWSRALAVNDAGEVVGESDLAGGERHAFFFEPVGETTYDLNDLLHRPRGYQAGPDAQAEGPGGSFGPPAVTLEVATAINDDGSIVACGRIEGRQGQHGFLLVRRETPGATPSFDAWPMGELYPGAGCVPGGMNRFEEVVGASGDHAFIWHAGRMVRLGGDGLAMAKAVNDDAEVAGWFFESPGRRIGCVWTTGGRHELRFGRNWKTAANDLNGHGEAVGWASREGWFTTAVLWVSRVPYDLTQLALVTPVAPPPVDLGTDVPDEDRFEFIRLEEATAIDARGLIAGWGRDVHGTVHGFLLRPLP